jgi:iron-sulfur cluster assembly accessory protein
MITLTENAIKAVRRFITYSDMPKAGLRIAVTGGGCSGLEYSLKLEETPSADDTVVEYDKVKVIIDPKSMTMIDGMSVDFVDSLEGSGFKFTNPNATKSCACGTSFSTGDADAGSVKSCS